MVRDYSIFEQAGKSLETSLDTLDQLNTAHQAAEDDLAQTTSTRDEEVQAKQKALEGAADAQQKGNQAVADARAAVDSAMASLITAGPSTATN